MKGILKLLGLGNDATEEQALGALSALKKEQEAQGKLLADMLGLIGLGEGAEGPEVKGTLSAMKQGFDQAGELAKKIAELEALLRGHEAEELVALAMTQGKIMPAQKDWAEQYASGDPEGFRAFVAKAAVVLPQGRQAGVALSHEQLHSIDELQTRVNRAVGLSDEIFKKHNPVA